MSWLPSSLPLAVSDNLQTFREEAVIWKHLNHPNVSRFRGITTNPLQIISDRMPGGTLPEYIEGNPGADRIQLVGAAPNVFILCLTPLPFSSFLVLPKVLITSTHVMRFMVSSRG